MVFVLFPFLIAELKYLKLKGRKVYFGSVCRGFSLVIWLQGTVAWQRGIMGEIIHGKARQAEGSKQQQAAAYGSTRCLIFYPGYLQSPRVCRILNPHITHPRSNHLQEVPLVTT